MRTYRSNERSTWRLPSGDVLAIASRRLLAFVVGVVFVGLAAGPALFIGTRLSPRLGLFVWVVGLIAGVRLAFWLGAKVPPSSLREMTLTVQGKGTISLGDGEYRIHTLRYVAPDELLWFGGLLGLPKACVRVDRDLAWQIARALQRPELGIRTEPALSAVVTFPWVGSFIALAVVCAAVFGIATLLSGVWHMGVPFTLVALPLSVMILRPSFIRLTDTALEWTWLGWVRQRVPLSEIAGLHDTDYGLLVTDRSGARYRFDFRLTRSDRQLARAVHWRETARIRAFREHVESALPDGTER